MCPDKTSWISISRTIGTFSVLKIIKLRKEMEVKINEERRVRNVERAEQLFIQPQGAGIPLYQSPA